jgi:WD40 repeat protein
VAFSPDGTGIVSGSYDQTLKVWDAQSGQEKLSLKGCDQTGAWISGVFR